MKIIQYQLPDISKMEVTKLENSAVAGSLTLTVENSTDFAVNDYIVIENVGNELAEMRQISAVPSAVGITVGAATTFAHQEETCIRKTPFNQARIYRSADNVTYNIIATLDLDWQDKWGLITYIDNTGDDSYYYKVEYWNSTTNAGIISGAIKTQTQTGFLTIDQFKEETGIIGNDLVISQALAYAAEQIKRHLYTKKQWQYGDNPADTSFNIPVNEPDGCYASTLEFADANMDGILDKNDFVVWEEDTDGVRTYVTSDINNVDIDRHIVTFTNPHPSTDKKLVFEYYLTTRKFGDYAAKFRRLSQLYAMNYVYSTNIGKRMQRGISSWTLNGVNMNFDMNTTKQVMDMNEKQIKMLIEELQGVYIRTTRMREPDRRDWSWFKSTLHWR